MTNVKEPQKEVEVVRESLNEETVQGVSTAGVTKRTDSALKFQAWKRKVKGVAMGLVTSQDDLTEGRVVDPGKLAVVGGGSAAVVLLLAGVWLYSMRGPVAAKVATQNAGAQVGGAQPAVNKTAEPAKPVIAGADISQRGKQQQWQQADQAQPRPRVAPVGNARQTAPAPLRSTTAQDEPRRKEIELALAAVVRRQSNRDPLTGSSKAGGGMTTQLPPPAMLPTLMAGQGGLSTGGGTIPPPPSSFTRVAYPGAQNQRTYPSAQIPQENYPYPTVNRGSAPSGDDGFPPVAGRGSAQQTLLPEQSSSSSSSGWLSQSPAWQLLPPGNLVRAVSRTIIQVGRGNRTQGQQPPVFAQIKGAVRVDGVEVIADGAVLMGRVVSVDESLGRVNLEFDSLAVDNRTIPLRGASAWTLTGSGGQEALGEGLAAVPTGSPNYLLSDAASAGGQAAATVARTLGQTSTSGIGGLGNSYSTSIYSGDLNSSMQRGLAQGLSNLLTRQVSRSDKATSKQESQGVVWQVPPNQEFVVYFSQGV